MPCKINNTSNFDVSEIEDLIKICFLSPRSFGFKIPVLNLISDEQNTSPLGKTAYYDPGSMEITIYVDGRHPKDIMRSFSHELVHHHQNENGQFANVLDKWFKLCTIQSPFKKNGERSLFKRQHVL